MQAIRTLCKTLAAALALGAAVGTAQAATAKLDGPLTVVVGYAPGGASDRAARIVAHELQHRLGVNIIVENKTGAGGRIAANYVKSTPKGKNVLLLGNPTLMMSAPLIYKNIGYDPQKDFKPVSMVTEYRFGVAVSASSPIKDLAGLIAWGKAHPEQFNVGVPATGSLPHFFALMLASKIGIKGQVIGYRGSTPLLTDLIGNSVPVAIDTYDVQAPQHLGGKIRILATSGPKRETLTPNVPTFTEAGVKLQAYGWGGFFAPASMPDATVQMLGKAIAASVATPAVSKQIEQSNLIPVVADAAKTAQLLQAFRAQWVPVVKNSGYVVEK